MGALRWRSVRSKEAGMDALDKVKRITRAARWGAMFRCTRGSVKYPLAAQGRRERAQT